MGYNLANRKMNKCLKTFLVFLMFLGTLTPALLATNNVNSSFKQIYVTGNYISGVFKATDDNWSCVITLKSDGTFVMVQREGRDVDTTTGTYTLSDNVYKGGQAALNLYSNGSRIGSGLLAWPEQDGLCIILEGYVFYKL